MKRLAVFLATSFFLAFIFYMGIGRGMLVNDDDVIATLESYGFKEIHLSEKNYWFRNGVDYKVQAVNDRGDMVVGMVHSEGWPTNLVTIISTISD